MIDATGSTVTYNGLVIGGTQDDISWHPPKIRAEIALEYDAADRSVVRHRVTMTVQTVFVADSATEENSQIEYVRNKLSKPGQSLKFDGVGLGFPSTIQDFAWGPKPRIISLRPLCNLAHEMVWQVEFAIYPTCSQAGSSPIFESIVWSTNWAIDEMGKTIRTMTGQVTIPSRRTTAGNYAWPSADRIREQLNVVVPLGFQRISQNWSESPDHRTLTFSVTDRELRDGPFPAGIIEARGLSTLGTSGPGFAEGVIGLSMQMTVATGVPRGLATIYFLRELRGRQTRYRQNSNGKTAVIPMQIQVAHELWGRTSMFNAQWAVTGCLTDLLLGSELYRPVDGNYQQWAQSLAHIWRPRGIAGLQANPAEDAIISVCDGISHATIGTQPQFSYSESQPPKESMFCEGITEDNSWLLYESRVKFKAEQAYTEHRSASDYLPETIDDALGSGYVSSWSQGERSNEVEYQGLPQQRFLLQWRAIRVKYKPVPPKLVSIGGKTAYQVARYGEGPKLITTSLGCPVYAERVTIEYVVTDPVQAIEPMKQKTICNQIGEEDRT